MEAIKAAAVTTVHTTMVVNIAIISAILILETRILMIKIN